MATRRALSVACTRHPPQTQRTRCPSFRRDEGEHVLAADAFGLEDRSCAFHIRVFQPPRYVAHTPLGHDTRVTPCGSLPEKHLLRKVDQRGGSGVDQGGSGWIRGVSWTYPCSKPSRNIEKRGEIANGPTACGRSNLSLYKIKREKPRLSGAQDVGALRGGIAVAF